MDQKKKYHLHHHFLMWSTLLAVLLVTTTFLLGRTDDTYGYFGVNLSISPSFLTTTKDKVFDVDIVLDTSGIDTDGVDIFFLHYNPRILEVQDADASTAGIQVTPGSLFKSTLINNIDVGNGTLQFSQVSPGGTHFKGSGKLATISFKAINDGNVNVTIDFAQGSTSDSNVAGDGIDRLNGVTNAAYTVYTSAAVTASTSTTTVKNDYNFGTVTLRNGSRGEAVKELQRYLNARLNLGLVIDGKLGPKTIVVIKKWQSDRGLVPDGLIGAKTKARMNTE